MQVECFVSLYCIPHSCAPYCTIVQSFPGHLTSEKSALIYYSWPLLRISLVWGFLSNLGLFSDFYPWTTRPKWFMYLSDLLLFLPCLSWNSAEWASSSRIGRGRCSWVWASPMCLLRAAFVVEADNLNLGLSCYHQQGLFTWLWYVAQASFCAPAAQIHGAMCISAGFTSGAHLSSQVVNLQLAQSSGNGQDASMCVFSMVSFTVEVVFLSTLCCAEHP